jgi:hypothetical protein
MFRIRMLWDMLFSSVHRKGEKAIVCLTCDFKLRNAMRQLKDMLGSPPANNTIEPRNLKTRRDMVVFTIWFNHANALIAFLSLRLTAEGVRD